MLLYTHLEIILSKATHATMQNFEMYKGKNYIFINPIQIIIPVFLRFTGMENLILDTYHLCTT